MQIVKSTISIIILIGLVWILNVKFGDIPPLGAFLSPAAGFWQNAETAVPGNETLEIPGLREKVYVVFDERRVPHIFAENIHDLYMAQGYVTARDRLFQLEVQAYDAAGRLSEFLGSRTLSRDIQTRHLGMPYGAEKDEEMIMSNPLTAEIAQAYSAGINALISSLSKRELPIEYKFFDFEPELWSPLKSMLFLQSMTRQLAFNNGDIPVSNSAAFFGDTFVDDFLNTRTAFHQPIIPGERTWDFKAEGTPEAPRELFKPEASSRIIAYEPNPANGSNNWAVSGKKTASGFPILANDPHLNMTLPAIWYEIQLNAPGRNVYGVSIPGSPSVIVGFNEHVAWGVTNTGSDVMDYYEITFKDESKNEYWHENEWKPTTKRIEAIRVRGGETVIDTLVFTHHGPVIPVKAGEKTVYHALRWIAHEPSNDLLTFHELNAAENYRDYENALKHYTAPAQNFVFASSEGDIAMWVNGLLPKKWKFQGQRIGDGSSALYDWHGWIPREQNPWIKNPKREFVSSANQESAAEDYPYYLDYRSAPFERGARINNRLKEMENITVEEMQDLQMDVHSLFAEMVLPYFISKLTIDTNHSNQQEVIEELKNWDYLNDGNSIAASVFFRWWNIFNGMVFRDEIQQAGVPLALPARDRFAEVLIQEQPFPWFDNITTPETETSIQLINESFKNTLQQLSEDMGAFGDAWKWGYVNNTNLSHIGQIPGLGERNIFTSGGRESVNAISGSHGPSWRMVVSLIPGEVEGFGVFPGGASGNPGSPNYTESLEKWRKGELNPLRFFKARPESGTTLTLSPAKN